LLEKLLRGGDGHDELLEENEHDSILYGTEVIKDAYENIKPGMLAEILKKFFVYYPRILFSINKEREELKLPKYTLQESVIVAIEIIRSFFYLHGYFRKDGKTGYAEGHIIPTAENLPLYMGVTSVPSIVTAIHHDDKEDLKKIIEELLEGGLDLPQEMQKIPPLVYIPEKEEEGLTGINERREGMNDRVDYQVSGVTKIRSLNKEKSAELTFRNFLYTILRHGAKVVFIKFADRLANLRTIENLKKDSKERMRRFLLRRRI